MRRNSGVIGPKSTVSLDAASGVHDSFDEYNNRLSGTWPRNYTASVSAVDMKQNESKNATITFTGGIDNGTYYWTLENLPTAVTTAAVLSATSGTVTVTNGSGTVTLTSSLKSTYLTSDQTFNIAIRKTSLTGAIVATSATCYLRACSVSVTVPSTVNEDSNPSITFAWSGLAPNSGSNYYWTWQINQSNSPSIYFLNGSTITTTYSSQFVLSAETYTTNGPKVMPDYVTTTGKTFTISVMMNGVVIKTSSAITVSDTISNANSLTISVTGSVEENNSAPISVTGATPYCGFYLNVATTDNSSIYYSAVQANSSGTVNLSLTLPYSSSFSDKNYIASLYNYYQTSLSKTSTGTIVNITPTITSSSFSTSIDETGTNVNITFSGSALYNKTFSWTVTGVQGTIDSSDFLSLSGTVTSNASTFFTIPLTITADTTTESSAESFYLAIRWTDPNGNSVDPVQPGVLGGTASSPVIINDTSQKPIVGPGFILTTAAKVSDFNSYNSYTFPANSNGGWLTLFKRVDSTHVYLQCGQSGSYDAPLAYLNYQSLPGSVTNYASYNGSNQYPSGAGWATTRPSWNSNGSKAWFWKSDGRIYEYIPNGSQNYGLYDLNSYSSLNYAWLYSSVNSNYVYGGGDCCWNNDGTAVWISYATNYYNNSYNNFKIVYNKFTLMNGGTPYNYQHLNSNPSVTIYRNWSGAYPADIAQFQFNHDGTQVYMKYEVTTGGYDGSKANKIISYALATPYDLQSGTVNNTFDGVTPAQEWTPTTPSWSSFNPGLIRSFFFDNKEWNKIYIAWASDSYSYQGLSVYTVADPEPASAITVTPQFKLSSATLKNTTDIGGTGVPYNSGGSLATLINNAGDSQSTTGRGVVIPTYDMWNSSNNGLRYYDLSITSTTASLRQTQSNFGTWLGNTYIRYGGYSFWSAGIGQNSSSITLTQIYGGPNPYSLPSQTPWSGNSYQLNLPSGTQCSSVGSGWVSYTSATGTWTLYIAYHDAQGPYYTRLAKWEVQGGPSWNGATSTLVATLMSTYYGSMPAIYYSSKFKFNNDSGTQVTTIRNYLPGYTNPCLVTYTCSTAWVPPVSQGSPDPTPLFVLQMPNQYYYIVDFEFDYKTQDAVYVLAYDINSGYYKLLVYTVPMPYLNWKTNQPTDTPTVNTLGPEALLDGGNNSSFSIIFDTEAHATQFETVLKGYLDANIYNDSPNNKFSNLHVTYGGRYSTVKWSSSTTGKSSYVTRTTKTVTYNSGNGTNDITVTTSWSPDGMWWTTNTVNRVGFYYANYSSNTKISFDSAVNGIAYNTAGFDTLASACNTAGVGILDAYGRNKSKWLYYDIYGSNDNGYLNSPATNFLGMSFTGAASEPQTYWAQQSNWNGDQSVIMFTLADAKNATTNAPSTATSGPTIVKGLVPSSVMQSGGYSFSFNFSTAAKATSFYNAIYPYYQSTTIRLYWYSGMYVYDGQVSSANNFGTTVDVSFYSFNQNYTGGNSGTEPITWEGSEVYQWYQNSGVMITVDLASSSVESGLANGTIQLYGIARVLSGQNGGVTTSKIGAITTAPGGQISIASSGWSTYYGGGNYALRSQLGTSVQAAPQTSSISGLYYAKYEYGTLFLDFQSGSSYNTVNNNISGATSIAVNFSGGQTTFTSSSFTVGSWPYGPWGSGYGIAIGLGMSGTITGYTPYNGESSYWPMASYTYLAELVTFNLPYTTLQGIRVRADMGYIQVNFPSASDGNAFAQWLPTQPPNTAITFDAYDDWTGTPYRFRIYYNSSMSITDPYAMGYQMVRIQWQYPWDYQDFGQYSGSYYQGSGRITSP